MSYSSNDNLLFKVLAVLFWLASFLWLHWISCSIPAGAAWAPQRCRWEVQETVACARCHCSNLDLQLWSRNSADASVVHTHQKKVCDDGPTDTAVDLAHCCSRGGVLGIGSCCRQLRPLLPQVSGGIQVTILLQ